MITITPPGEDFYLLTENDPQEQENKKYVSLAIPKKQMDRILV